MMSVNMNNTADIPCVLTIAGSDSGGGAGIQGDLKTFAAWRCYGASVITAITAQNTMGVHATEYLPAEIIAAQMDAILDDLPIAAIKIGMLGSVEIVLAIAERLLTSARGIPVVLDPVLAASDSSPLIDMEAQYELQQTLFPLATLVTPNLSEACILLCEPDEDIVAMESIALDLRNVCETAVLLKGGHRMGDIVTDYFITSVDEPIRRFSHPRLATRHTHGTGCALSSAIAAGMARGLPLERAVAGAIDWLQQALAHPLSVGHGNGPVNHFWEVWGRK